MLDGMIARPRAILVAHELSVHALAQGDELHLGRHLAASGVVHLSDDAARAGAQWAADRGEADATQRRVVVALSPVGRGRPRQLLDIVAPDDPAQAQRRQAQLDVGMRIGIGPRTAGVVEAQRWLSAVQADLAHGNAQVGAEPVT
jgi:hypothetical protein